MFKGNGKRKRRSKNKESQKGLQKLHKQFGFNQNNLQPFLLSLKYVNVFTSTSACTSQGTFNLNVIVGTILSL